MTFWLVLSLRKQPLVQLITEGLKRRASSRGSVLTCLPCAAPRWSPATAPLSWRCSWAPDWTAPSPEVGSRSPPWPWVSGRRPACGRHCGIWKVLCEKRGASGSRRDAALNYCLHSVKVTWGQMSKRGGKKRLCFVSGIKAADNCNCVATYLPNTVMSCSL